MNIRQIFLVILTFIPLLLVASVPQNGKKIKCVVIDAGHGGHDPGAVSASKVKEKDISLKLALKLGKMIEKNHSGVKVVYTRKTDVFVELHKRAAIANDNKADLFISIHCNSSKKCEPFGVETWVMGLHKSAANLEVAKKENGSILMEKNHAAKYDGFNPNSAEAYIIFSLFQNMYLNHSLSLANVIQNKFKSNLKLFDRGVKQAGFLVLYKTAMPSVLVEVGFLSNKKDEAYITKPEGQESLAFSLYQAFVDYKISIEGSKDTLVKATFPLLTYDQIKIASDSSKNKNSQLNIDSLTLKYVDNRSGNSKNRDKIDSSHYKKPRKMKTNLEVDSLTANFVDKKMVDKPNKNQRIDSLTLYVPINKRVEKDTVSIIFRVQFISTPTAKDLSSKEFEKLDDVFEYKQGTSYKYTAGKFYSIKNAVVYQTKMQTLGYTDCFVVAFNKSERISPTEATRILNEQNNKGEKSVN